MDDLKASWEYEQPWIPNKNRLFYFIHYLSEKLGFHDWFHRNKWCIRFGNQIIMECDLSRILKEEIRKEIDFEIMKQLIDINNHTLEK